MVSKKMRIISIVLGVIMLWLGFFGLIWCGKKIWQRQGVKRIESAISISLPKDAKVEYHYYDISPDSSFFQYTVFVLKEEPTEFLNSFTLIEATETWGIDKFISYAKSSKAKENHIPSFDEPWMVSRPYFITDTTSKKDFNLVYLPQSLKLIFMINFIG